MCIILVIDDFGGNILGGYISFWREYFGGHIVSGIFRFRGQLNYDTRMYLLLSIIIYSLQLFYTFIII